MAQAWQGEDRSSIDRDHRSQVWQRKMRAFVNSLRQGLVYNFTTLMINVKSFPIKKRRIMKKKSVLTQLSIYYFILFCGLGGVFPLLSLYLSQTIHLSGSEIGTVMSIGPIITLFFQPAWGMVTDYTGHPKRILAGTLAVAGLLAIPYYFAHHFATIFFIAILLAIFQSAIVPISDSLTVSYTAKIKADYGNIRLWGALGFAVSAFIMGRLSETYSLSIIFIGLMLSFWLSMIFVRALPHEGGAFRVDLTSGVKQLTKMPKFMLFIAASFLLFGPIQGNNVYFGLLISQAGGTVTGVGFAFLLAAGTEAPFMRLSGPWIRKSGFLTVTLLAGGVSCLRWIFYSFEPGPVWLYVSTIAQGFSVGLFIPAGINYVKQLVPTKITATAVSLYSAAGNGLGNWFSVFIGGFILDKFNVNSVYIFYAVLSFLGLLLLFWIRRLEKAEHSVRI